MQANTIKVSEAANQSPRVQKAALLAPVPILATENTPYASVTTKTGGVTVITEVYQVYQSSQ